VERRTCGYQGSDKDLVGDAEGVSVSRNGSEQRRRVGGDLLRLRPWARVDDVSRTRRGMVSGRGQQLCRRVWTLRGNRMPAASSQARPALSDCTAEAEANHGAQQQQQQQQHR
jgi:hypothetical protein